MKHYLLETSSKMKKNSSRIAFTSAFGEEIDFGSFLAIASKNWKTRISCRGTFLYDLVI